MWFKEFFSETGASMTRLLSFMLISAGVITQIVILWIALHTSGQVINGVYIPADTNVIEALTYAEGFLVALGLGAKVGQKFGEKSSVELEANKKEPTV